MVWAPNLVLRCGVAGPGMCMAGFGMISHSAIVFFSLSFAGFFAQMACYLVTKHHNRRRQMEFKASYWPWSEKNCISKVVVQTSKKKNFCSHSNYVCNCEVVWGNLGVLAQILAR